MARVCRVAIGPLALLAWPIAAKAVQSDRFGAYPTGAAGSAQPWFRYATAPGQSQQANITVENHSPVPMDFLLYPADAAPNGDGGFGMTPQGSQLSDAGSWIHLEIATMHLEPHATQEVGFRFSVPLDASVGRHYGGIIVQPLQTSSTIADTGVHIISRLGVRLYEAVPGMAQPGLKIQALTYQPKAQHLSFSLKLYNSGNTLLAPFGTMTVTNGIGRRAASFRVNIGTTLKPGRSITTAIVTRSKPGSIPYYHTATVRLGYDPATPNRAVTGIVHFWTGDIALWGAITIVALGAILGLLIRWLHTTTRHRRN